MRSKKNKTLQKYKILHYNTSRKSIPSKRYRKRKVSKTTKVKMLKKTKGKRMFSKKKSKKKSKRVIGGGFCKNSAFVGKSWNVESGGNYYPYSKNGIVIGGINKQLGGGIVDYIPQDLVNLYRSGGTGLANYVNNYKGKDEYVSPYPEVQPEIDNNVKFISTKFPDVEKIFNNSQKSVINL